MRQLEGLIPNSSRPDLGTGHVRFPSSKIYLSAQIWWSTLSFFQSLRHLKLNMKTFALGRIKNPFIALLTHIEYELVHQSNCWTFVRWFHYRLRILHCWECIQLSSQDIWSFLQATSYACQSMKTLEMIVFVSQPSNQPHCCCGEQLFWLKWFEMFLKI